MHERTHRVNEKVNSASAQHRTLYFLFMCSGRQHCIQTLKTIANITNLSVTKINELVEIQ